MAGTGPTRVGVLGGTFDPIHNGHLAITAAARRRHDLEYVLLIPAREAPHKREAPVAGAEHRLAMARLAAEGRAGLRVSDCELNRPGPSYTVDTMRQLREELGPGAGIYFIIGSDMVPDLPAWKEPWELIRLCTLVVAARPAWPMEALDSLAPWLSADQLAQIKAAAVFTTAHPVSSTEVRRRVALGGPISDLVPGPVARYISQNKLYRAP